MPNGFKGFETDSFKAQGFGGPRERQKMREDYGWRMTDAQYETVTGQDRDIKRRAEAYQKSAQERIDQYNQEATSKIDAFREEYGLSEEQLAKTYKELGPEPTMYKFFNDWWDSQEEMVDVRTYYNGGYYGTMAKLPKTIVDQLHRTTFNQGEGSFYGNYAGQGDWRNRKEEGLVYYANATPMGISDGYGKELREMVQGVKGQVWDQFKKAEAYEYTEPKPKEPGDFFSGGFLGDRLKPTQKKDEGLQGIKDAYEEYKKPWDEAMGIIQGNLDELTKAEQLRDKNIAQGRQDVEIEVNRLFKERQAAIDAYAENYRKRSEAAQSAYAKMKESAIGT